MVSVSPRLRDSLDYEDPEETDPRLSSGFRSLSINSAEYDAYEPRRDDRRPFASSASPGANRRSRRQRQSDQALTDATPFEYRTSADGDVFRLAVLLPGTESATVECHLEWESSRKPRNSYYCLSYCWGDTTERTVAILLDGDRFAVTKNLHKALQCIRKPNAEVRIWVDQICINQGDHDERAHQVSIMKHIFNRTKVIVWLGDEADRSGKLCEYARKMSRTGMQRILSQKQLQDAVQNLLLRKWFTRVWVIPEVALANFSEVAIGHERISWDNLVRLVAFTAAQLPQSRRFDKQTALLGNPRMRIAIISQMNASQREGLRHTDITQLLILAKSSEATDVRDKVYALQSLAMLRLRPDYRVTLDSLAYNDAVERVYIEIAEHYAASILWDYSYSKWHDLSDVARTRQLMSILYSAGRLHQHLQLPSWVPDWTFAWYQAPFWCTTEANLTAFPAKDSWCDGIRSPYRAGGDKLETFELMQESARTRQLRVSALVFDSIADVSETTPAASPAANQVSSTGPAVRLNVATFSYGRVHFRTRKGLLGLATGGVQPGDNVAILLGGDVPVVLRSVETWDQEGDAYTLMCECFIHSDAVMNGDLVRTDLWLAEDIVFV
ncbi:hypothetical protein LTR53_011712 [Teratosphaeriaceae sp. CCFEE 6253]|nr:hypothetical protein LTR53_011712 [Teratosphaeriaceae sp. CCFEE 6253]